MPGDGKEFKTLRCDVLILC